jgi:mono/diheme cytochrome c family protein
VQAEPAWDSGRTRVLAQQSCFDCHSNLTKWPWDSNIAPFSWLIQRDVDSGRSALNFSEWNNVQDGQLQ